MSPTALEAFLTQAGWADAARAPLAADASTRAYLRLTRDDGARAVLMQAPVARDPDRSSLDAFRRIGAHLRGLGLSAPQEIAAAPDLGLILMEDLGDATLASLLATAPAEAERAYGRTTDLLAHLATCPAPPGLDAPEPPAMVEMIDLTLDRLPPGTAPGLKPALTAALARHAGGPPCASLRDVHGDNLLWLPDRAGHAAIGLLDFQDAVMLPRGYDLASLLDDPRRVVPEAWRAALVPVAERPRIATLSALRNLRILGIFHRLATERAKPHYAAFLPRTRALVARAGAEVDLPVAEVLDATRAWEPREGALP